MKIAIISLLISSLAYSDAPIFLRKNVELLRTYESLTNVNRDKEIMDIYNAGFVSLPKNGDVTELTDFALIAMLKLSQAFCHKMYLNEVTFAPAERWVLTRLDLKKDVSKWNDNEIAELTSSMGEIFWGEIPDAESSKDLSEVFKSLSKLPQPAAQSSAVGLTCATMLLSPYVYTK